MISAFGVDHGVISKLDYGGKKEPSTGRKVLASSFPGIHGAVAGKKGKKARSAGNQFGGSLAGSTVGAVAGAATRNRNVTNAGAIAGGILGSQAGLARNTRKGYLKAQD